MRKLVLVLALAAVTALSACHRPDPGQLTPAQKDVFKGS